MNRSGFLLFFSFLSAILLAVPAHAQTPPPAARSEQPEYAPGTVFTQSGTPITANADANEKPYGPTGLSITITTKGDLGKNLTVPDLTDNYKDENRGLLGSIPRFRNASDLLNLWGYQKNLQYNSNPMQYSGCFNICQTGAGENPQKEAGCFVSAPADQLVNLYHAGMLLSGPLSPGAAVGTDLTKPPVAQSPVDCSTPQGTGIEMPAKSSTPITSGFFGWLSAIFNRIFNPNNNTYNKNSDTLQSLPVGRIVGDGDLVNVGLTGEKDPQSFSDSQPRADYVKNARGALANFIPGNTTLETVGHGQEGQDTRVNAQAMKFNYNEYKTVAAMDCNTVMAVTQDKDPVRPNPDDCRLKTAVSCGSIDFSSSSCKMCGPDKTKLAEMLKYEADETRQPMVVDGTIRPLPDGIPPKLKGLLEKAGETFNVPPSSILAVMFHEGAFTRSWYTKDGKIPGSGPWTDENVEAWGMCNSGHVPNCNPEEVSYAVCGDGGTGSAKCGISIAGFGWLPYWFWKNSWEAVRMVDPSRTRETISPCNLMDSAFAIARALSHGAAYAPPSIIDKECFGVPMTNKTIPISCTAWTDPVVFQSHVTYAGYCPETGKNAGYPPNDAYKDMVLNWYHAGKCQ